MICECQRVMREVTVRLGAINYMQFIWVVKNLSLVCFSRSTNYIEEKGTAAHKSSLRKQPPFPRETYYFIIYYF